MLSEKGNAQTLSGGAVLKCGHVSDDSRAGGQYLIRHFAPKNERDRGECHRLLKAIDRLLQRRVAFRRTARVQRMQRRYDSLVVLRSVDTINNVVCTLGKNVMLDAALAGSGYSVVGPYMGLISSVSYGVGPAVGDTMSSHAGWVEAGSASNFPLYTTPRKTCVWSAAGSGSKALSAALSFPIITTGGTVKGCFIVYGTGAVSTIADTNGTLYSAGTFTSGDKIVGVGDTLQVSYQTSL